MMKEDAFPLSMAPPGQEVKVVDVTAGRGPRRRLVEMGFIAGARVRVVSRASGGPFLVAVGESRFALSPGMAHKILVR